MVKRAHGESLIGSHIPFFTLERPHVTRLIELINSGKHCSDRDGMTDQLAPNEILDLLNLEPNATCGFVRLTFVSKQSVAAGVLPPPFAEARPIGSALYFLSLIHI